MTANLVDGYFATLSFAAAEFHIICSNFGFSFLLLFCLMQAMNFFAGLLLLLMPEENAFWYVSESIWWLHLLKLIIDYLMYNMYNMFFKRFKKLYIEYPGIYYSKFKYVRHPDKMIKHVQRHYLWLKNTKPFHECFKDYLFYFLCLNFKEKWCVNPMIKISAGCRLLFIKLKINKISWKWGNGICWPFFNRLVACINVFWFFFK